MNTDRAGWTRGKQVRTEWARVEAVRVVELSRPGTVTVHETGAYTKLLPYMSDLTNSIGTQKPHEASFRHFRICCMLFLQPKRHEVGTRLLLVMGCTRLFPCQGVHEGGDHISWLFGVGMGVVVDARGIALYPGDGVTDDSLEKSAIARPLVAIRHLLKKTYEVLR